MSIRLPGDDDLRAFEEASPEKRIQMIYDWRDLPDFDIRAASTPGFASTPRLASVAFAGFDTSLTAPSTVATCITGGSSGTKVNELYLQATGTTVAGVANIWAYDSSNYHLLYQYLIAAVTSSTTALAHAQRWQPPNLVIPSSSWSVRGTHTVTGNDTNKLRLIAYGADL